MQAYGEGRIELDAVPKDARKDQVRYAPSFIQGDVPSGDLARPYTVQTVSDFLGWSSKGSQPQDKVRYAPSFTQGDVPRGLCARPYTAAQFHPRGCAY